jgi:hypothetical protein
MKEYITIGCDIIKVEDAINEIMEEFAIFGFKSHMYPNVSGMWEEEQRSLLWLCLTSPRGFDSFLEIGSHCGASAVLMCLASRFFLKHAEGIKIPRLVYSVDINFDAFGGAFKKNLYRIGKYQDIHKIIECNSVNLQLWDHIETMPSIGCALVDGWHSYKAVINDFLRVDPFIVDSGYVVFHDTAPQPYKEGQLEEFYKRSLAHHDEWMQEVIPDVDSANLQNYHAAEQQQNFFLDEAIAYILNNYNYELVNIPIPSYAPHFDRVPVYKHGSTSPFHSLAAIRKLS